MKAIPFVLLALLMTIQSTFVLSQESSKNPQTSSLVLPHFQVVPIQEPGTDRAYELYIKLPKSYSENPTKNYPVLYFTDAFWHVEALSAATEYMLEDIILVGISWQKNADKDLMEEAGKHVSRYRDYSMQASKKPEIQNKYNLGHADKHLDFIRNTVFKYVENNYRADLRSRTYFGYSLGGEFGSYILLTKPDTFQNYIIGSPSIKNEVPYLTELNVKLDSLSINANNSLYANVFLTYGTQEKDMAEHIEKFVEVIEW